MQTLKKIIRTKINLPLFSAILSAFTLLAFHIPFFRYVASNVESGFNSIIIILSLAALMLALNYFFYYLILYLCRMAGRILIALMMILNSTALYFIVNYDAFITAKMMGNVFNTRYSEASAFFSWSFILYVGFLGLLPGIWIILQRVDFGKWRGFFANIGGSLATAVLIALLNMTNWPWIDRNSSTLGGLLMPWSYTINSIRLWSGNRDKDRKEIPLPDARIATDSDDVCILVIGESARRANFSLYGYPRPTNPLLSTDSVAALNAVADATYTTAGVKAILSHKSSGKLYEILPNYLSRTGVDVTWRTSNWGEPPVHIKKYLTVDSIRKSYPDEDANYDGILLAGLPEAIRAAGKGKQLIIIHTSTSHGPTYYQKYPKEYEVFTPVCKTVEMSKANHDELINAYDNTILYTDRLLHEIIAMLKNMPDKRGALFFISDHGESLGENNLYMHGVPMTIAPKEQIEIPFIVWTSDKTLKIDPSLEATQYHVFHSVLDFLGIESPVYNPDFDIFRE